MSKKSNGRRDVLTLYSQPPIANHRLPEPFRLPSVSYKTNQFALSLIEDRRQHEPGRSPLRRDVRQFAVGRPARLALVEKPTQRQPSYTKALVAFAEPNKLPLCVRRGVRKEVLHAKGVAGSRNLNKPTRNQWSDVSCRS